MKIATTTGDFSGYFDSEIDCVYELYNAGFRYIDLSLYNLKRLNEVYTDENWLNEVKKLKITAEKLGVKFVQAHCPANSKDIPIEKCEGYEDFLKGTLRSIEICGELGIKNTVYHAGLKRGISKSEWQKANAEFIKLLIPTLERCNVNLLVENSTAKNTYDLYYTNSGSELREFIDLIGHKNVGACWDTGHANCEGSQYDDIVALGDKLYAIHYNDNHGACDEHIAPYFGTLNHDEVLTALKDINYNGYFTLECSSMLISNKGWPHKRREFKKDERLAVPPLFLQQEFEKVLYKTAKYLLETYELFEE